MKKQVLVLLVLVAVLLSGGSLPAVADSYGKITGGIKFVADFYDPPPYIVSAPAWAQVNVIEVEPWVDPDGQTHNAKGWFRYHAKLENTGWVSGHVDISCVVFGEDDDGSYAVTSGQLVSARGSDLGIHVVHKVYDNGTPGRKGDIYSYFVGDALPGWSYEPVCNVPADSPDYYVNAGWYIGPYPVERGNLVIHP